MPVAHKRTIMTMYTDPNNPYCHQVRLALAEKGIAVDVLETHLGEHSEGLLAVNPHNTVPTLVDRELVLYQSRIIMEYLDERFPHPPLLPVYPVFRAKSRLLMHRIEEDWYSLYHKINDGDKRTADKARKELQESLIALTPVFAEKPFFMSEEFSLVDCCLAPLLWRLPQLGIEIPKTAKALNNYANRLFELDSFVASLTEVEREIRAA